MADVVEEAVRPPEVSALLRTWQRVVLSVVAAGGVSAGTVATFITKNSVGSGVLLALGALFGLIGIVGDAPRRLKIGGNEIEWFERYRQAEAALSRTLAEAAPDAKEQVAEAVIESRLPASEPVRQQAESFLQSQVARYENAVGTAFLRVGAQAMWAPGHDERFDAVFRYEGKIVGVEVKYTRSNTTIKQTINRLQAVLAAPGWPFEVVGLILVVPVDADYEIADGRLLGNPHLLIVRWSSPDEDGRLRATLDNLLRDAG